MKCVIYQNKAMNTIVYDIEMYVARDANGALYAYDECPKRSAELVWYSSNLNCLRMPKDIFNEVGWVSNPLHVDLVMRHDGSANFVRNNFTLLYSINGYVARDLNGELLLFVDRPCRAKSGMWHSAISSCLKLPADWFPNVDEVGDALKVCLKFYQNDSKRTTQQQPT